jgi:hypothetical protein
MIRDAQTIEMMKRGMWEGPPGIDFFKERLEMYREMLRDYDPNQQRVD